MSSTIYPPSAGLDLYRLFGLTDTRSDRARAEEALTLVLGANPDLAPDGWCTSTALIERAIRFRAESGVVLRPRLVEAFAWCRTFFLLGCQRVVDDYWNRTDASRMAFLAERAGEAVSGRTLPIEPGVAMAAALSLGIPVRRYCRGLGTGSQISAYCVWERWR